MAWKSVTSNDCSDCFTEKVVRETPSPICRIICTSSINCPTYQTESDVSEMDGKEGNIHKFVGHVCF